MEIAAFCIKLFVFLMFTLAAIALQQTNFVAMAILVVGVALATAMCLWSSLSKWAAVAMVLIFIGGMMVLFLYVASLSAGPTLSMKINSFLPLACLVSLSVGSVDILNNQTPTNIVSFFSGIPLAYLIFYLILTLLLITKITESFKGALARKFF